MKLKALPPELKNAVNNLISGRREGLHLGLIHKRVKDSRRMLGHRCVITKDAIGLVNLHSATQRDEPLTDDLESCTLHPNFEQNQRMTLLTRFR